jgi:hypothetical protein
MSWQGALSLSIYWTPQYATLHTFEADLATIFAHEGFSSTPPSTVFPFVIMGMGAFTSKPRDLGVTGLSGDMLRTVKESTELADSLLRTLARENVE